MTTPTITSSTPLLADVVIVGAGIAGLWLLNRLCQRGVNAILLEQAAIGGGQTRCAQGIIHGGAKYALTGKVTAAAERVATMTAVWAECLQGRGEIDLRGVTMLSHAHYLWSPNRLTGGLQNFVTRKLLNSQSVGLRRSDYPALLQHSQFQGSLTQLNESVLDVPSLVKALAGPYLTRIWQAGPGTQYHYDAAGQLTHATVRLAQREQVLAAAQWVLTAGEGNEALLQNQAAAPAMQRRPLRMVWVRLPKSPLDYRLYLHCTTLSSLPRLTITTHFTADGQAVWYLGGGLAETGVDRSDAEQIQAAQAELADVLPWVNLQGAQWGSFLINRAEADQGGKRPDDCTAVRWQNTVVAWPTKLTLAPALAQEVIKKLTLPERAAATGAMESIAWPAPPFARAVWES